MTTRTPPVADVDLLEVRLHGEPIGTLTRLSDDRVAFAFSRDYIEDPGRNTLSLAFKDDLGGLLTDHPPTRPRLLPYFSNLLPEGALRDYLARHAGVKSQREFFLLWALGDDLPGAVTVRPAAAPPIPAPDTERRDRSSDDQPLDDRSFRFSLAGMQLKFSAVAETTGGLTIPARGVGGSWIVKLPSPTFDRLPENEQAMMTLARRIGIDVPETRLLPVRDIANLPEGIARLGATAFAIRRFDRTDDSSAVHAEDFAQVFGVYPEDKYGRASYRNVAEVIWTETGEPGLTEFIRRLVFNALIGNADMHLKNWSLVYHDGRTAALAPAYDYVSTIAYLPDDTMALKCVRTKEFSRFSTDELRSLADRASLPRTIVLNTARETVARFHDAWANEKTHLGVPDPTIATIDAHLRRVPIAAAPSASIE
ncbi:MAG: type II toxin-antitoxin system HipA family toxin [Acidobacteria bacterium]|nr:type II toxin-antitoxin system HipA family toxin [Acidobacteriota bacterium]